MRDLRTSIDDKWESSPECQVALRRYRKRLGHPRGFDQSQEFRIARLAFKTRVQRLKI